MLTLGLFPEKNWKSETASSNSIALLRFTGHNHNIVNDIHNTLRLCDCQAATTRPSVLKTKNFCSLRLHLAVATLVSRGARGQWGALGLSRNFYYNRSASLSHALL
jgi:hypothetical protein